MSRTRTSVDASLGTVAAQGEMRKTATPNFDGTVTRGARNTAATRRSDRVTTSVA
jgi:hypothetical protein